MRFISKNMNDYLLITIAHNLFIETIKMQCNTHVVIIIFSTLLINIGSLYRSAFQNSKN